MIDYGARILADSIAPSGVRLTTIEATFPRIMLSEFNTHRMLSRNSASSRAIPPEKQIERVKSHPFIPVFGSRVTGMGQGDDLTPRQQRNMQRTWLTARDRAVEAAERLVELGADKSHTNRVLEPYMWHTVIVSATEWDNFLGLRTHKDAAPEIRRIAVLMEEALIFSDPVSLDEGELHLPLVDAEEIDLSTENESFWAMVSVGRCARVSFDTHHREEDPAVSHERAERLAKSGHWSPFEHVAAPSADPTTWSGNFQGWTQFRKLFPHEANFRDKLTSDGILA